MKVYQIVELTRQTIGHGDSADVAIVASSAAYSVKPYPLYTTREQAEEVIESEDVYCGSVIELELV
jgi:hypothetical protein